MNFREQETKVTWEELWGRKAKGKQWNHILILQVNKLKFGSISRQCENRSQSHSSEASMNICCHGPESSPSLLITSYTCTRTCGTARPPLDHSADSGDRNGKGGACLRYIMAPQIEGKDDSHCPLFLDQSDDVKPDTGSQQQDMQARPLRRVWKEASVVKGAGCTQNTSVQFPAPTWSEDLMPTK